MKEILILILFFFEGIRSEFDPTTHPNWKLLEHDICGHVDSLRIIGGQEAPMNAYPWLVRIGYVSINNPEDVYFRCGGVIVNSNTVITAAHCVSNLPPRQNVKVIRLGEHDIKTNPDCDNDFCADPVVDIEAKQIIVPQNYNYAPFKHDIAIIRLKRSVKFTAFIKPICLVSGKIYRKNLVGSIGEVAGWGVYNIDDPQPSPKLMVVKLPIIDNSICIKYFPPSSKIGNTQLCIGGEVGKDSCAGDSGGPVMMVDDSSGEPRYYILGIVSFGSRKCGKTEAPGVYTKIASYMKWILDNLEKTTQNANVVF